MLFPSKKWTTSWSTAASGRTVAICYITLQSKLFFHSEIKLNDCIHSIDRLIFPFASTYFNWLVIIPHSNRWPYSSNFHARHWPNTPRKMVVSTYSTSSFTNLSSPSPKSPVRSNPTRMYNESPASSLILLNSTTKMESEWENGIEMIGDGKFFTF